MSADEQPEVKDEHDKDSDAGSVYDGSVYGTGSYQDSTEDLSSKGHIDLHMK